MDDFSFHLTLLESIQAELKKQPNNDFENLMNHANEHICKIKTIITDLYLVSNYLTRIESKEFLFMKKRYNNLVDDIRQLKLVNSKVKTKQSNTDTDEIQMNSSTMNFELSSNCLKETQNLKAEEKNKPRSKSLVSKKLNTHTVKISKDETCFSDPVSSLEFVSTPLESIENSFNENVMELFDRNSRKQRNGNNKRSKTSKRPVVIVTKPNKKINLKDFTDHISFKDTIQSKAEIKTNQIDLINKVKEKDQVSNVKASCLMIRLVEDQELIPISQEMEDIWQNKNLPQSVLKNFLKDLF